MTELNKIEDPMSEKVNVAPGISLSKVLAEYWPNILRSKRSFIKIIATPTENLTLRQSSFGHYPALPKGFPYPKDAVGNYMYPLAQINFSEVPPMSLFPRSGYLQFYISKSDGPYGINFDDQMKQEGFRVLFFEEQDVKSPETDFPFLLEDFADEMIPLCTSHSLEFRISEDFLGVDEIAFEKNFDFKKTLRENYPDLIDDLEWELRDAFPSSGHRLGGYAMFTQEDPRKYTTEFADLMLLFQMDGDEEIMWGDAGVGNFFIHPDDLAERNFSRVLYNWDCC